MSKYTAEELFYGRAACEAVGQCAARSWDELLPLERGQWVVAALAARAAKYADPVEELQKEMQERMFRLQHSKYMYVVDRSAAQIAYDLGARAKGDSK